MSKKMGKIGMSGRVFTVALALGLFCACEEQQKQVNRFRDWQEGGHESLAAEKGAGTAKTTSKASSKAGAARRSRVTKASGGVRKPAPRMKPPRSGSDLPKAYQDLLKQGKAAGTEPAKDQEWLKPDSLDLGKHRAGSSVKGRYTFKNPTGKEMTIQNIASSCTCQSLVLVLPDRRLPVRKGGFKPLLVPAGTQGTLEFQVEATDSERKVYVTLFTSDPENPQITVAATIRGVRDFQVLRGERVVRDYQLGLMKRKETRQVEVRVKSTDGKPFKITGHDPFPEGLDLVAKKDAEDPSSWWLRGSFRAPSKAGATAGGKVVFRTDRSLGFEFDITAMVLAPVRVLPKTVQSLSGVPQGESRSVSWTLEGIDPETRLEAARAFFELDPNSQAKLRQSITGKDFAIDTRVQEGGHKLQVDVKTPKDLPPGLFMGNVVVQFKDKTLSPLSLRLMVQVRRARH